MIAPEGIRRSFTGGGDGRRLPLEDGPCWLASVLVTVGFEELPLAAVLSEVSHDGVRRDFARYDVDETERGSDGRREVAGERGGWST